MSWFKATAIVLGFLVVGVLETLVPPLGFVIMLPVYAWVFFGSGAATLRGAWPATFMMEDVQTERGVKLLFLAGLILQSLLLLRFLTA